MTINRRRMLAVTVGGVAGLAGCLSDDDTEEECDPIPTEPGYAGWLDRTSNYRYTCDFRDRDQLTVVVGSRANQAYWGYAPAAVAITPETTVRWEWNGRGGHHDVKEENGRFDSGPPVDSTTETFTVDFDTPGIFKYYCTPHRSQGMRGAVFVALD